MWFKTPFIPLVTDLLLFFPFQPLNAGPVASREFSRPSRSRPDASSKRQRSATSSRSSRSSSSGRSSASASKDRRRARRPPQAAPATAAGNDRSPHARPSGRPEGKRPRRSDGNEAGYTAVSPGGFDSPSPPPPQRQQQPGRNRGDYDNYRQSDRGFDGGNRGRGRPYQQGTFILSSKTFLFLRRCSKAR